MSMDHDITFLALTREKILIAANEILGDLESFNAANNKLFDEISSVGFDNLNGSFEKRLVSFLIYSMRLNENTFTKLLEGLLTSDYFKYTQLKGTLDRKAFGPLVKDLFKDEIEECFGNRTVRKVKLYRAE